MVDHEIEFCTTRFQGVTSQRYCSCYTVYYRTGPAWENSILQNVILLEGVLSGPFGYVVKNQFLKPVC